MLTAGAGALAWRGEGSIAAAHWLGYAVAASLLLAAVLLSGTALHPGRTATAALACLLAFAAWSALAVAWSPLPALGRDEALLTVFYAVALAVPVLTVRREAERLVVVGAAVATAGVVAVAAAVALATRADPVALYHEGRLLFPISYENGLAAFFLVPFWPAIALAASRTVPVPVRAGALGSATILLSGWLLTQSKGGAAALAASALVFFAVAPARLRALPPMLVAGALVAASAAPLTEPFRASEEQLAGTIADAGQRALLLAAIGAALGLVYAAVDARTTVPAGIRRAAGAAVVVALAAGVVGGAAAFFARVDHPGGFVEDRWREFKRLPAQETGTSHLSTLGSNRYDFWRVSLLEFRDHPVAGIGSHGFPVAYLQERRSPEAPQHAHSLPLDALSGTGAVGFLPLAGALGLLLLAAARSARRSLVAASLLATGVYWLAHTSVDWVWQIPAAGVPVFVLLGLAARGRDERLPHVPAAVGAAAAVALALLAFAPPWLSARFTAHAYGNGADRGASLRWARRLDPLATAPLLAEARLARSPEDLPPLRAAVRKEPRRAELHYLLGRAYLRAGRRAEGRRELREALRLHPDSALIENALRRAR